MILASEAWVNAVQGALGPLIIGICIWIYSIIKSRFFKKKNDEEKYK